MAQRTVVSFFAMLLLSTVASAQTSPASAATSQEILQALAEPLPATAFKEPPPSLFADWTAAQKQTVPRQISGRCLVLWTMMNDSRRVRLLPPALEAETPQLVLAVCVSGKMPADWPGRAAALADATAIMQRSTRAGLALHLPPSLAH